MEQVEVMMLNDKSTLHINFAHIAEVDTLYFTSHLVRFDSTYPIPRSGFGSSTLFYLLFVSLCRCASLVCSLLFHAQVDPDLAEVIEAEFLRFEPYLRHALQEIVIESNPGYITDINKGQRYFELRFNVLSKSYL